MNEIRNPHIKPVIGVRCNWLELKLQQLLPLPSPISPFDQQKSPRSAATNLYGPLRTGSVYQEMEGLDGLMTEVEWPSYPTSLHGWS